MAHLYPDTRSLLQILASSAVKIGECPKHIAIIMDGNRRFANAQGLRTKFGHQAGLALVKAKEVCRWMYEMQIREVTLYAFSIENFKRSKEQVDELMDLLHDYCVEILNGLPSAKEHGCCVNFIGCWGLIPTRLKPNMARIMLETRHCTTLKINVAVAYTGRNGILRSMNSIQEGLGVGQLQPQDVTEYLVDEAQNLIPMSPVDMLIRTGGDSRISDFLMWEASHAYVHFMDAAWPELSCWKILDATVKYQRFRRKEGKLPSSREALSLEGKERVDKFLENIRDKKWEDLTRFSKNSSKPVPIELFRETAFRQFIKELLASV